MGTSLLFFGVFAAMLYMATRRGAYLVGTVILLVVGAFVAYKAFGHVRVRVENWTDPVDRIDQPGGGFQAVQGWYGSARVGSPAPGSVSATLGSCRSRATDYVFTSIGEELGLVGHRRHHRGVHVDRRQHVPHRRRRRAPVRQAVRGGHRHDLRRSRRSSSSAVSLRVIPLTGITLPFVSYGGSSLVANFALVAILLRISDDTAQRDERAPRLRSVRRERRHPPRRCGNDRVVHRPRRAAHLPPGGAQRQARRRSSQLPEVPPQRRARPRPDRDSRRRGRRPLGALQRRVQAPARLSRGHRHAVLGHRRLPVDPVRRGRRRADVLRRSRGPYVQPHARRARRCVRDAPADRHRRAHCVEAVQQLAADGLAGRPGSVVVLDVRSGGVLAAYSNPTYDPNLLVNHNPNKAQAARSLLLADPSKPLLPHAWRELYPPGSTFKTVTASIAIQNNVDVDTQFPVRQRDSAAADERPNTEQLRWRAVRRLACSTASSSRATRRSRRSDSISASCSRRASRTSACRAILHRAVTQPESTRPSSAAGGRSREHSSGTSRPSCRMRSARTTCSSHLCRWRSSPSRSRPAARSSTRTSSIA